VDLNVVLLVVHVFLALGIIGLVLLQKGKGAGEGASFGGGASTVFGASGSSNFLSKTTAILATCFFINSLALAYLVANRHEQANLVDSIDETSMEKVVVPAETIGSDVPVPAGDGIPVPVEAENGDVPPAE
jgi:preprotein translocase subunit SecG